MGLGNRRAQSAQAAAALWALAAVAATTSGATPALAAPDAVATPAPPPDAPPPVPAARPILRIALPDLQLTEVPPRWGTLIAHSLALELRKLEHTSVITDEEIRALLEHEAEKQLLACAQESCFSELADALGVDAIIIGTVAIVGDQHVFGIKRLDPVNARVVGQVTRRFQAGNGEELLVAIGPAVAELFADVPLRAGKTRGVAKEVAQRLNPPPLPPWVVVAGASTAGAAAVGSLATALLNLIQAEDLARYKASANPFVIATFNDKRGAVDASAIATWSLAGAAVAIGAATGVAALFTDFSESATAAEGP
ncbi:MAG: hypothetical protein IT383_19385 [Deltaproteobacteria bacterium]|nr:hypothetical protein [Deltaproteobacteria bacterium]